MTLPKYSSVGSYALFYFKDNRTLCYRCATRAKWSEQDAHANWENPALMCDKCERRIESAYREDFATARYTVQLFTESGSFARPDSDDVKYAKSVKEVNELFRDWKETVSQFSDESCTALVWRGPLEETTDIYPDYQVTTGPRGGCSWGAV